MICMHCIGYINALISNLLITQGWYSAVLLGSLCSFPFCKLCPENSNCLVLSTLRSITSNQESSWFCVGSHSCSTTWYLSQSSSCLMIVLISFVNHLSGVTVIHWLIFKVLKTLALHIVFFFLLSRWLPVSYSFLTRGRSLKSTFYIQSYIISCYEEICNIWSSSEKYWGHFLHQ